MAKQSFLYELQFILMTVVLASASGISVVLKTACSFMDSHLLANYLSKLLHILLPYIYLIAIGFINRRIRMQIFDKLCLWTRHRQRRASVMVRPLCTLNQTVDGTCKKRRPSEGSF
ncbi:hypothetical protein COOONC_05526 [Cooperia oncophora]